MALTPKQTLILWGLIVQPGGSAPQKTLLPKVEKADREALVAAKFVTTRKGKRNAIWIEVTDPGWDHAARHLDAPLPANAATLQGWLTRLKHFLDARGLALADVLAPAPAETVAAAAALPERIRAAYLECTGGALNKRVFLRTLRERLFDVDRTALDEALRAQHLHDGVHLSGSDNPAELTAADRASSLAYKGETMHVIWVTQ
jgi:hypothetical protein